MLGETGKAGRYGAVMLDTETGEVTPVQEPTTLLSSVADVKAMLESARKGGDAKL